MNNYKAKIHISTGQFEFIEIETEGSIAEIKVLNEQLKTNNEGLGRLEWNNVLDDYRSGKGCTPDHFERMNTYQLYTIKQIDLSDARMGPKELRNERVKKYNLKNNEI